MHRPQLPIECNNVGALTEVDLDIVLRVHRHTQKFVRALANR